ncbi:hypothetical protein E2C01_020600 [Portunus trituberculatus]|uniref:Uncharacterized protein n=1 Tax=Portunus trituberculatus TaxID=210409 RepID=A0A5B7E0B4_PORTR|nr:hypothetical protein [Portunus trituberculatus]
MPTYKTEIQPVRGFITSALGLISSVPGHTAISILHTIWQFIQLQKLM